MGSREDIRGPGQYELPHPPAFINDPFDSEREISRPLSFVNDKGLVARLSDQRVDLADRVRLHRRKDFLVVKRHEKPNVQKVPHERGFA